MNAFDYFFENSRYLKKDFVMGPKEKITFEDLYINCIKFAAYLNLRTGRNQNILLIAPNSVFFITSYMAILKSGNVAVPLSPETEIGNLRFIQEKCRASVVITTTFLAGRIKFGNITVMDETTLSGIPDTGSSHPESLQFGAGDQLAEIIFTSGSTGVPKGVMISHKNLVANTSSIVEYLGLTREDTMLVVLPFYYCYGLSLLHTHLRTGGSIVLNNMFIMLGGVINDLKRYSCTGFAGVPSHFQILLRKSETFKKTNFPALRYVTQAGGKLHNAFIIEFQGSHPEISFFVMYGQTEATARLSYLPPELLSAKIGSCGKGISGVELKVVDEEGKEIKPGETGEIVARGDNLTPGYFEDSASTSEIIRNGWLHTGDLATVDQEGYIYITARKKEILKVGGRRVSPKEVEEVIVTNPGVIDCSIEGIFDHMLGETMKATVVARDGADITADSIKAWCTAHLAHYKVPQLIDITHDLKISSTGKKLMKK